MIPNPEVAVQRWTSAWLASRPQVATFRWTHPDFGEVVLRQLRPDDEDDLAAFFDGLWPTTAAFYDVVGSGADRAVEHVLAIGRYDKVRMVLTGVPDARDERTRTPVLGLLELSLDLVADDVDRFRGYGIELGERDGRFGICLADAAQGRGLAAGTMPAIRTLARMLGKSRLILWGGVQADNTRARRFYRRMGFVDVGGFARDGRTLRDGLLDLSTRPDGPGR